jgi:hypothetical protein
MPCWIRDAVMSVVEMGLGPKKNFWKHRRHHIQSSIDTYSQTQPYSIDQTKGVTLHSRSIADVGRDTLTNVGMEREVGSPIPSVHGVEA